MGNVLSRAGEARLRILPSFTMVLMLTIAALLSAMPAALAYTAAPQDTGFERDRAAILAMAGNYRVTFNFTETVAFQPGYELKDPKLTNATEVVRVIKDTGRMISLQHTLVAAANGRKFAIKHWRQDWVYEPAVMWDFTGFNAWTRVAVGREDRAGAWAQLVYQVDDAPRYSGLGRWVHEGGVSSWEAGRSWRPLPRRDATTRDDYQVISAINRHALTPAGWVHEQDNTKIQLDDGGMKILAREIGINTYTRANDFDASVAQTYWDETADYWAAIRGEWDRIAAAHPHFGLTLQGEPEALYGEILGFAEAVRSGDVALKEAITEALDVIRGYLTDAPVDGRQMAATSTAPATVTMDAAL